MNSDASYLNFRESYGIDSPLSIAQQATAVSIFSGCGGLDLGARLAGVSVKFAADSMQTAVATMRNNFDNTNIVHGRVQDITSFPEADMLIGGYPCQSFSMGGRRKPNTDKRSLLYKEYARCLHEVNPKFFVAENVAGLRSLAGGEFLQSHLEEFESAGKGFRTTWAVLDAAAYGVPQHRKRLFIVGVRNDLGLKFNFPEATHGDSPELEPFVSHGDVIADLPIWPEGEFYERPHDPESTFSWYYMSRNRKSLWDRPARTVVANWRHTALHPASPTMHKVWSDLKNGFKQGWEFTEEHDHIVDHPHRPILEMPRRLSWRECARIQTFPDSFEPVGTTAQKITQIGNAVPPLLAYNVIKHLISGAGLSEATD